MGKFYDADQLSGAEYLASIYGTESDKTGACRHWDKCNRTHTKPTFSPTILLRNFYQNPYVDVRQPDAYERMSYRPG
ncbi:CBN-UAF-2 protein [Aphelenchoides avenae]|nr:CBN-UAF-2 protein [Aphelenchus avenae]